MKIIFTVILASFTTIVYGQHSKVAEKDASNGFGMQALVKDYLNVPGPIKFANASYNLTWSAHPSSIYYKQEYIPAGDTVEHFNKLILIDVVDSNLSLEGVIKEKIYWLENQKK